jgi:DNA-nicking Smr family endonuclease
MSEKGMRWRLGLVFTEDELLRIKTTAGDIPSVTVDVHGMGCLEAKTFLKNVIALFRGAFKLIVIHGFNNGTAIRDMVRREKLSSKVTAMHSLYWNDGVTEFDVQALCA